MSMPFVSALSLSATDGARKLCRTISEAASNCPESFSNVEAERYDGARYFDRKDKCDEERPAGGSAVYGVRGRVGAEV